MTTLLVDKRDQVFILKEMLQVDNLCHYQKFAELSGFEMVLNEAHRFAKSEFYPTIEPGDKEGCTYNPETQSVQLPECFQKVYQKFRQGGWLAMCDSQEVGGDGFPTVLGTAVSEIFYAAGFYIFGAAELSHAGAKVLERYGTDDQKALYMTRLFSGEWMGTMCLTEPDAGSDVGAVQTTATQNKDGTFRLCGTKIFISAGDHGLTENIVHMVLARVEGDPSGTRGLSLFIVPKYLTDASGKTFARNDVSCVGIEKKMGLHGFPTCTMAFGNNGQCTAYLLGEKGKGIVEMFHMMNEQRLLVGIQGLSYASTAFLHAVEYTQNRKQGVSVHPGRPKSFGPVAIVQHPDIKRMLLTMKAYVEGGRALAYYTSHCMDYAGVTDGAESARFHGLVELLTPVLKAYLTDNAWNITGMAIQCAGGYGYCSDYPFERLARDCKVASIYEGTNGIQAIDLVFRKIIGDKLVNFNHLMERMGQTILEAKRIDGLQEFAEMVNAAKQELEKVALHMAELYGMEQSADVYAKASPFLEAMGDVILAWLHLWQLSIAYPKFKALAGNAAGTAPVETAQNKSASFYNGKVLCAEFFIGTLLKRTFGKLEELKTVASPVTEFPTHAFAG